MNFFKRLFSRKLPEPAVEYKFNEFALPPDKAYNVYESKALGFYMIKDSCITCGAPEAEAPDLIEHAQGGSGECYFKKQPETEEEVGQAISAVWVSCIGALRYGGNDEQILKRMYELGLAGFCDYQPAHSYSVVNRNVVAFYFDGPLRELGKAVTQGFIGNPQNKVIDYLSDKTMMFSFIVRRWDFSHGALFICKHLENGFYKIIILDEHGKMPEYVSGYAFELHKILKEQVKAANILWYENEITYGGGNHIPW
jgi:hypothetical protein